MEANIFDELKQEILRVKQAFQPMPAAQEAPVDPAMQQQAPAPQGGAPMPPQGGAPMPPQGGQGGGVIDALMQAGIDPNQALADPNLLAQLAAEVGMAPEQLAQMIQAEMQGGGAPMPPQGGGAPMPPQGGGAPMPPPPEAAPQGGGEDVGQITAALEGVMGEVERLTAENQELRSQLTSFVQTVAKIEGQQEILLKALKQSPEIPAGLA